MAAQICSLTGYPVVDPFITNCGHCFEKQVLGLWIKSEDFCPIDYKPLKLTHEQSESLHIVTRKSDEVGVRTINPRQAESTLLQWREIYANKYHRYLFELHVDLAKRGNAESQFWLGCHYFETHCDRWAFYFFNNAATKGSEGAKIRLRDGLNDAGLHLWRSINKILSPDSEQPVQLPYQTFEKVLEKNRNRLYGITLEVAEKLVRELLPKEMNFDRSVMREMFFLLGCYYENFEDDLAINFFKLADKEGHSEANSRYSLLYSNQSRWLKERPCGYSPYI